MRTRCPGSLAGLLVALLAGMPSTASASPPPEARAITATPSTDLVDGQEVAVAGTGWPAGDELWITVCATGTNHCGGTSADVVTGPDGAFATTVRPRVRFTGPDLYPVDCLASPCEVRARPDTSLNRSAGQAIAFDPSAPRLPPPTIAVEPAADLVDGQTVTVTGDGYGPDQRYWVAQCPASAAAMDDGCVVYGDDSWLADATGHVVADTRLAARIVAIPRPTDCRVVACTLSFVDLDANLDLEPRAAIAFDPDGSLLPQPELEARPSADLRDAQAVRVVGSGFDPGEALLLSECIATDASPEVCDLDDGVRTTVAADGTVDARLVVHPTFTQANGGTADCERGGCVIRAYRNADTADAIVDAAIAFAVDPTPSAPSVVADPTFAG